MRRENMKKLIPSKYNLIFENQKNGVIIYNTLMDNYCNVNGGVEQVKTMLNNPSEIMNVTQSYLLRKGFLIDSETFDEEYVCDELFVEHIHSNTLTITLQVTDGCNFNCIYCPQDHQSKLMTKKTYDSVLNYVIKNKERFTHLELILFGGEPSTAHKSYLPFLKELNKILTFYGKSLVGSMVTNGYLITNSILEELYNLNVCGYQITLDGNKETHNRQRMLKNGNGSFDVVYSNILNIKERTDLSRLSIGIRINVSKELLDISEHWLPILEPFSNDGRFYIDLAVIENRGGDRIGNYLNTMEIIDEMHPMLLLVKEKLLEYKLFEGNIKPNFFVCKDMNKKALSVDAYGSVRACSSMHLHNAIGSLESNGNVILSDLKKHKEFYASKYELCENCELKPLCHGKACGIKFDCRKEYKLYLTKRSILRRMEKSQKIVKTIDFFAKY